MLIASVALFVLAVAVAVIALAGLAERLPRNRWAGVRTPDTLRDEEAFALANKVAGPTLLAAAGLLVIGGLAGILVGGALGVGALLVSIVAAALTAATGGSLGARAAAAIRSTEDTGACGGSCGACSLKSACQPS